MQSPPRHEQGHEKSNRRSRLVSFIARHVTFRHTLLAELFVLIILLLLILQSLFLDQLEDVIISIFVFSLVSLIGAYLVYSIRKEAAERDESRQLAAYLREANRKLQELDSLKSEFIYLATHQLRTPLTSIRGHLSMVLDNDYGNVPSYLHSPLQTALVSSKEMVDTIEYFLNVTRIERGDIEYEMDVFDMKELVRHTAEQMRPMVKKAGLTFHIDIDENQSFPVYGDKDKLRQVVTNLIDNAIHYTEEGSVTVHLWKHHNVVRLEVQDTGIGLSPEDRDRIFTKFGRADGSEKRNVFGAGLGLYIAREILFDHDGEIDVVSEGEGKGSTFYFELAEADQK